MHHLLVDWFGYPDGSVLTNLIASVIAFAAGAMFGLWRMRVHLDKVHVKLDSLHEKQDRLHASLAVPPSSDVA